jgi:hypothetical protein
VEDGDTMKQGFGYRSWSINTGTVIRKRILKDAKRREQLKTPPAGHRYVKKHR